jgi:hypothetical protein
LEPGAKAVFILSSINSHGLQVVAQPPPIP